jgi:hypothetical protein
MGFHVAVRCTHAIALRQEIRRCWPLPDERQFKFTGLDWLVYLLGMVKPEVRDHTLLFWRRAHMPRVDDRQHLFCRIHYISSWRLGGAIDVSIFGGGHC